jgi:protein transport protein SEC24
MTKIPATSELLLKSRIPLGILIHPFKDLDPSYEEVTNSICSSSRIVRCRNCRTYINPFVLYLDLRRWKCNVCFRTNELPPDYDEPHDRPEINNSIIEFIAGTEYMVRPPPPASYVFLLDVSWNAVISGYLKIACDTIRTNLANFPGDKRTQVAIIGFNSGVNFFVMSPEFSRPHMQVLQDIDGKNIKTKSLIGNG